jgi:hypothetical protein
LVATRTHDHLAGSSLPQLARLGDHQPAEAEAEIERLVDVRLLFEKDVLAHDAEVGGAVGHVGRDVGRLEKEQAEPAARIVEDEAARVLIHAVHAELTDQLERVVEEAALGQRHRQPARHVLRSIRAPRVVSLFSRCS